MTIRLTIEQIIEIHDEELSQGIGLPGIKDYGHLELICEKPFSEFFGEEQYPGLFFKAAVLMHGLVTSHCFFDCNKRTAVVSTFTFLYLNGFELNADEDSLFHMTIDIATGKIDIHRLTYWLQRNCIPT